MFRTTITRQARLFSTTPAARKSVVDTAKDVLKKVDKVVADQAVKGIEKGEQAADAIKSNMPNDTTDAKHKAQDAAETVKQSMPNDANEVKGKASELAGEAKGKASELAGEAKGTANKAAGQAQGTKEEIKGKAKGATGV